MPVTHGVPTITINHDHQFLVCDTNATMVPTAGVGFFARDTRFVSGYNLTINGRVPLLLDASPFDHFSARWEFTSPELPLAGTRNGAEHDVILEERALGIRLDRTIFEGIHEDYDLINYAAEPVRLILEVAIESDFADVFDVLPRRLVRRGELQSCWHEKARALGRPEGNMAYLHRMAAGYRRASGSDTPLQCGAPPPPAGNGDRRPATGRHRNQPSKPSLHLAPGRGRYGSTADGGLRGSPQRLHPRRRHPLVCDPFRSRHARGRDGEHQRVPGVCLWRARPALPRAGDR